MALLHNINVKLRSYNSGLLDKATLSFITSVKPFSGFPLYLVYRPYADKEESRTNFFLDLRIADFSRVFRIPF